MIKSFKHKGLEDFFYTGSKKGIKSNHASRLSRILDRLNAANEIKDMNYPGSFLHQLSGDKKGLHAVEVFGNWRVFLNLLTAMLISSTMMITIRSDDNEKNDQTSNTPGQHHKRRLSFTSVDDDQGYGR
jgi:proteic killer suppression protein